VQVQIPTANGVVKGPLFGWWFDICFILRIWSNYQIYHWYFFKWSMVPIGVFLLPEVIYVSLRVQSELLTLGVMMWWWCFYFSLVQRWQNLVKNTTWSLGGMFFLVDCFVDNRYDFSDAGVLGFGRLVNIHTMYDYIMYIFDHIWIQYFIVYACICMNILQVNIDVFKNSVIFHPL